MRATRAYIASAGTATLMLGSAVAMLVLVSTFVAFGSWPGSSSGKEVDQLLLNEVARPNPQKVAVGTAAVRAARHAEARRRVAVARGRRQATTTHGSNGRTGTQHVARTPSGAAPNTAAGTPVAAAPGAGSPASTVRQQTENVTQNLQQTTQNVGSQVDKTTTQVNQVVDQVVGGVQQQTDQTVQQVQNTVGDTTNTVTNTVGGVKNAAGSVLGH